MLQLLNRRAAAKPPGSQAAGTTAARAPTLPPVDPRAAHAARLCHGALGACVAHAFAGFSLALSPAAAPNERPAKGESLLRLAHPAGVATIAFDLAAFPELAPLERLHADDAGAQVRAARNAAVRRPVLRALLAPLLGQLARLGLQDVDVLDLVRADGVPLTPRAVPLVLGFMLGDGPTARRHSARLWVSDGLLDALLDSLSRERPAPPPALAATLAAPGRLLLGTRVLAIAALQSLEPGDVLLRAVRGTPQPGAAGELAIGTIEAFAAWGTAGLQRAVARVELDANLLTFLEPFKMTDHTTLPDLDALDEHAPGAEPAHDELGSLDIPVSFEVDTLALPLDALATLAPGYVIELPRRVEQVPLKLVAWGRTIGTGELVAVGEQLGVRILSIAHRRAGGLAAEAPARQVNVDDPVQ